MSAAMLPDPTPVTPATLLPHSLKPKELAGVRRRMPVRYDAENPAGPHKATKWTEFIIAHDDMDDFCTSALYIDKVNITNAVNAGNENDVKVNSALDFIDEVALYIDDEEVESYQDVRKWANAFLAYSTNLNWTLTEGDIMLDYANQMTGTEPKQANGKSYAIPLSLLFGLFRIEYYFPLFKHSIKIRIKWASEDDVYAFSTDAPSNNKYEMINPHIISDYIELDDALKAQFTMAINGSQGLRIPYTTFDTTSFIGQGSAQRIIRKTFGLSNLLSVYLLNDVQNDATANVGKFRNPNLLSPLPDFKSLAVKCGAVYFTPQDGFVGHQELYRSTKLAVSSLCDLTGNTLLDRHTYTSGFTPADTQAGSELGYCLVGVNMEKNIEPDDNAYVNAGLSSQAHGANNELYIDIRNHTSTFNNTGHLLINLVHQRGIILRNGAKELWR